MEAVVKKDLVAHLKATLGVPPKQAGRLIDALFGGIQDELLRGKQVVIQDFAAIKVVEKKAQLVKDPATGHQFISPAENVISFVPIDSFQRSIESAKLSSIILAVPAADPFVTQIEHHFARVGWTVHIVNTMDDARALLAKSGAYLTIVDSSLPGSEDLIESLKADRETSMMPLVVLYPEERDPDTCADFLVLGDEHLVEPFEVYTLLMLAERELARSSEEEVIFDQQVSFQFGSTPAHTERAAQLGERLFAASGLPPEGQGALAAAFREAIDNAVRHGNDGDAAKLVKVLYLLDKEKITLVVQDEGGGFDTASLGVSSMSAGLESASRSQPSGPGLKVMHSGADRVEYNDTGNMVTLTRHLREAEVSPEEPPVAF